MNRLSNWNQSKRNACVGEFRRLLGSHRKDQVENAIQAGRSLAKLMADARVVIIGIDDLQLERYRRRFGVSHSLRSVMFAVATKTRWVPETVALCTQDEYAGTDGFSQVQLPLKWGLESKWAKKLMNKKGKNDGE